jgi:archaellin
MKNLLKYPSVFLALVNVFLLSADLDKIYAQEAEKNALRIATDYVKTMDGEIYFDIKATARVKKQNMVVPKIELAISNEVGGEEFELGRGTTNMDGEYKLVLKSLNEIRPDSSGIFNVVVSFKGNDQFEEASESISFKDAIIKAKMITNDSTHFVSAILTDASSGSPITEQALQVRVQRLFRSLSIGEDSYNTDQDGTVLVPVEEGIPGVDGNLTFEVVLEDSEDYGTVKALVHAPIGVPVVYESTFDERTMWSPRTKTPYFLLIFPNLVIFTMWSFIIYLIINLFKIQKS